MVDKNLVKDIMRKILVSLNLHHGLNIQKLY